MSAQSMKPGWKMVKFGDIAQNIAVRIDPAEATTEVYVGLEHLDPVTLHLRQWGHPSDVTGQKLVFKKGDVIFGRRRAYQRKLAVAEFEGICSAHAMVVRAKPEMILPEFLPFFLQSDMFMERAIEISVGSLSPTINWKTLRIQEFPLPPIKEQKRIAEILWAADEAVEKYRKSLVGMEQYIEALTGKTFALREGRGHLSDYCAEGGIKIGPFGSLLHARDYQATGVPVVMPADMNCEIVLEENIARISEKKAKALKNYRLLPNDVLFPRRGDLTKRALVAEHQIDWLCGTGTIRVRLSKEVNPKAVFLAVTSSSTNRWLERFSVGTTMPNLNATTIGKIPISLPAKKECDAVVGVVEATRDRMSGMQRHIDSLIRISKTFANDSISGACHV
jgi:restriction endonuclease S subunit